MHLADDNSGTQGSDLNGWGSDHILGLLLRERNKSATMSAGTRMTGNHLNGAGHTLFRAPELHTSKNLIMHIRHPSSVLFVRSAADIYERQGDGLGGWSGDCSNVIRDFVGPMYDLELEASFLSLAQLVLDAQNRSSAWRGILQETWGRRRRRERCTGRRRRRWTRRRWCIAKYTRDLNSILIKRRNLDGSEYRMFWKMNVKGTNHRWGRSLLNEQDELLVNPVTDNLQLYR